MAENIKEKYMNTEVHEPEQLSSIKLEIDIKNLCFSGSLLFPFQSQISFQGCPWFTGDCSVIFRLNKKHIHMDNCALGKDR